MAGRHNVLNALAAIAIADGRGIARESIEEALRTFRGVARRMQIRGEAGGVTVVDDFAHHPTAIRATIEAARTRWPRRRLWVAFEPRSNTMRRRVFEDDLAAALAMADGAVLGAVNRAQLLSDAERLSPERVIERVRAAGRRGEALGSAERNRGISGRGVARGRYHIGALERQFRRTMRQAARPALDANHRSVIPPRVNPPRGEDPGSRARRGAAPTLAQ